MPKDGHYGPFLDKTKDIQDTSQDTSLVFQGFLFATIVSHILWTFALFVAT